MYDDERVFGNWNFSTVFFGFARQTFESLKQIKFNDDYSKSLILLVYV